MEDKRICFGAFRRTGLGREAEGDREQKREGKRGKEREREGESTLDEI